MDEGWRLGLTEDQYAQHLADVAAIDAQEPPAVEPGHPAKFSSDIIPVVRELVKKGLTANPPWKLLDPFAGVGRIHQLFEPGVLDTYGIEIEPEWAGVHPRTEVGDVLALPWPDDFFHAAATSPCYGNRMADAHNAQERCKACKGTGKSVHDIGPEGGMAVVVSMMPLPDCPKCEGKGRRVYKRLTYTHILGRKLHPNNSGAMQWGPRYRQFHTQAWAELRRVLMPGAPFVLNISDHIRDHKVQPVVDWHLNVLAVLGFELVETREVETARMGFGENAEARVEHEVVALLMAP